MLTGRLYFNSTVVQLEVYLSQTNLKVTDYFNSTVVQLEALILFEALNLT